MSQGVRVLSALPDRPAFSRQILLLLLPGIPALAERHLADVEPEDAVRNMIRLCLADPSRVPQERIEAAVEEMREHSSKPWARRALTRSMRGLLMSYLRPGRGNGWWAAGSLRPPTLVLWGDRDELVDPALAPRLLRRIPDARLLVLEGVGHVAMLEAPEPTARAVLALAEDRAAAVEESGATAS